MFLSTHSRKINFEIVLTETFQRAIMFSRKQFKTTSMWLTTHKEVMTLGMRRFLNNLRYRWIISRCILPNGEKRVSVIYKDWRGNEKEAAHFVVEKEVNRYGEEVAFIPGANRSRVANQSAITTSEILAAINRGTNAAMNRSGSSANRDSNEA